MQQEVSTKPVLLRYLAETIIICISRHAKLVHEMQQEEIFRKSK